MFIASRCTLFMVVRRKKKKDKLLECSLEQRDKKKEKEGKKKRVVCVCVCGRLEMKGGILPPPPPPSQKKKKLLLADQLERQLRCFLDTWSLFFFFSMSRNDVPTWRFFASRTLYKMNFAVLTAHLRPPFTVLVFFFLFFFSFRVRQAAFFFFVNQSKSKIYI